MIIWSGMGIVIPFFLGLCYALFLPVFDEPLEGSYLHVSLAMITCSLVNFATVKKAASNIRMADELDDKIINGEMLSPKEEKYAKVIPAMKKQAETLQHSSLFFIGFKYWTYLLAAGGTTFMILHFTR